MTLAELYKFTYLGKSYYYTSHDIDIVDKLNTYKSTNISRGKLVQSQDAAKSDLTIKAPINFELTEVQRQTPSVERVKVEIRQVDPNLILPDSEYLGDIIFNGTISRVVWKKLHTEIRCSHVMAALDREILRIKFSAGCNHTQYGAQCGLNIDHFSGLTTITDIQSNGYVLVIDPQITVGAQTGTFPLAGAYIKNGDNERANVAEQIDTDTIKLFRPLPKAAIGQQIQIAPNCQQNWLNCRDIFGNLHRCTAFTDVPRVNPFGPEGLKG